MVSQILLLSQPRSACHLLERMLSKQPNVKYFLHPFVPVRGPQVQLLSDPLKEDVPPEIKDALETAYKEGFQAWEDAVAEAKNGNQILFTHTHPNFMSAPDVAVKYVKGETLTPEIHHDWQVRPDRKTTNMTVIPDYAFLRSGTIPLFTIRHPVMMVPSVYRAIRDAEQGPATDKSNMIFATNLGWSRLLHDWYLAQGVTPIVADSDDYMTNQVFVRKLSVALGLSPDHVIFTWPKSTKEISEMPQKVVGIMKTIWNSEGIIPGMDAKSLNLAVEEEKWKAEFGDETAAFLKDLVDRAMPHYEYLRERRFRVQEE